MGVSDEEGATVQAFVAAHHEMTYAVLADGTPMIDDYQAVGPTDGVPHAYVVKGGKVM